MASQPVLQNVDLEIDEGEFVLIVGPSGAGKSTLCQALNGIIPNVMGGEMTGDVIVEGREVYELELKDLASSMGMVFQDPNAQLCNIYVEDEIAFAPENLCVEPDEIRHRIRDGLNKVGLEGFEKRKVFELSGGQKQKVGIASVLSMEPKILVLDNATANLDPQATKDVFDLLKRLHREHGHTIVVVESKIDDIIHLVTRIVVMDEGRIIADGEPREILRSSGKKLLELGLWVPEMTELALRLEQEGFRFRRFPISVEEASEEMVGRWSPSRVELKTLSEEVGRPDAFTVKGLNYRYPSGTHALKDVNFSIPQGDFVAVLGTNGSGKTTLIKHLMGIIPPPQGSVFLKGEDIAGRPLLSMTEHVGYVFQNPEHQFVADTVFEECIYSLRQKHGLRPGDPLPPEVAAKGEEALRQINLWEAREKNPFMLSGGEKRRLSVVASLILGQDIVILDEPTTGQDFRSATRLLTLCDDLNRQGKTVIMVTHDIRLVCRWARSALVMHDGRMIYRGDVDRLFLEEEVLSRASLIEPPVSRLAKQCSAGALERGVITVEQFVQSAQRVREAL